MNKRVILLSMIGMINSLSALTIKPESEPSKIMINRLIKSDLLVVREVPKAREIAQAREARESRVSRMGRNSRGVRQERMTRIVYKLPKESKTLLSKTAFVKKNYLSKLSK